MSEISKPLVAKGAASGKLHLNAVDGVRAIACLMVVSHHCYIHAGKYEWPVIHIGGFEFVFTHLLSLGYIGVEFFFVLSGFCLAYPIFNSPPEKIVFGRKYALRRFIRIYPPYAVAFVLLAVLSGDSMPFRHWVLGLLLLGTMVNASFWTLCLEARWYFVFPFLIRMMKRFGYWKLFGVVAVLGFFYKYLIVSGINPLPPIIWLKVGPLPIFLPLFLAGIGIAYIYTNLGPNWVRYIKSYGLMLAILSLLIVLAVTPKLPPADFFTYSRVLPAGFLASAFLLLVLYNGFFARLVGCLFLRWVGVISYSVYLVHEPIVRYAYSVTRLMEISTPIQFFVFQGLVLPLCVVLGWVFFRLVELPFLNMSKKVGS